MESRSISNLVNRYHENKLSHAFLLETDDSEKCYKDILEFIKIINCPFSFSNDCHNECNLCTLIDNNNLPSLVNIDVDGSFIRKEQITDLIKLFSTKPVFSKYNIYIVKNAEKFNSSSANALLKFLEEPEEGIIGFFIVNNVQNVISTIRSRCQILTCKYVNDINFDSDSNKQIVGYLNCVYKNEEDLLYNRLNMVKLFEERREWEKFFNSMVYFLLNYYNNYDKEIGKYMFRIKKNDIISAIDLVENIIKRIKANGNIELILDKFVIEMRKFYE